MKPKSTLLLLAVFAVLAGAYWATGQFRKREAVQIQQAKRLFSFAPEAVKRIELKRVDGPLCAGERAEGGWRFLQPNPTIEALPLIWDRMAGALAALSNERTIAEAPADLKQYGLAEPRLVFSAETESGETIKLIFGATEPTQVNRFARLNDGPVFLVNEKQFFELDRGLDMLRNRFIMEDREAPLVRMEFARIWTGRAEAPESLTTVPEVGQESALITVARDTPSSPWRMLTPVEAIADQEAVEALAKEMQFALGDGYVDTPADLADYGLVPANARLTVTDSKQGPPQTFYFGDPDRAGTGRLFAKKDGKDAVFTVDGALLGKLPNTPEAFRERRLLTEQAKDIVRLDYFSTASAFSLVRDAAGAWAIEGGAADAVAQERANEFFTQLKGTRVDRFIDSAAVSMEAPEVAITLTLKDDQKPREIRLRAHPQDAGLFYGQQDTGEVGLLTADMAKSIMVSPESFRSRLLMQFTKADAIKIAFTADGKAYEFEKVHDLWVVRAPADHRLANQADAEMILNTFSKLMAGADAAEALKAEPDPGLENPALTMAITTRAPDGTETVQGPLYVGKPLPGQASLRFCALGSADGVFTVRQDTLDKVRDALRGVIPNPGSIQ